MCPGNFISPMYTFSLAGNINVFTPSQGTNWKEYFQQKNIEAGMSTLAGNKNFSVYHRTLVFHLSIENGRT